MALKDTVKRMHQLLSTLKRDLDKAEKGNKAASQRVRTCSIKLEKTAKKYRKESVAAAKKRPAKRKAAKKKPAKRKVAKKKPCKRKVCKTTRRKKRRR